MRCRKGAYRRIANFSPLNGSHITLQLFRRFFDEDGDGWRKIHDHISYSTHVRIFPYCGMCLLQKYFIAQRLTVEPKRTKKKARMIARKLFAGIHNLIVYLFVSNDERQSDLSAERPCGVRHVGMLQLELFLSKLSVQRSNIKLYSFGIYMHKREKFMTRNSNFLNWIFTSTKKFRRQNPEKLIFFYIFPNAPSSSYPRPNFHPTDSPQCSESRLNIFSSLRGAPARKK